MSVDRNERKSKHRVLRFPTFRCWEKRKKHPRSLRRQAHGLGGKTGENGVTEDKRKRALERGEGPLCQTVSMGQVN